MSTIRNKYAGFTLVESLVVFLITLFFVAVPIFSFDHLQKDIVVHQFFSQFEKRIYATQKIAIVSQQATRMHLTDNQQKIYFGVPKYITFDWAYLKIPENLKIQRHGTVTFAGRTGNNSSLKTYQFYWPKKKQTITYQFQLGSGHYTKKIE
ncbi:competence type IV pilus minor pilin ComGD [Enterococcus thailandicus]|uniref:competence type IV pilus minor pilin ComGD n=1 Tax=Enterococcus TaxID=1350 RepID=UPI001C4BF6B8|nr:competence type IV pilus minor pilin ComGD [Enterococcus thailandicus]MDA3964992.1 competence type IV pilus minor pilin ComGD [Enterococcus thailandicus]MDT2752596.1 competence type IV pilus minor pilin ComGD [Enterococcus thailandicus]MDT2776204.1 competence type IV pilus minor pilin ComGD [Enterococcus thailandicus]MDT2846762.1 competence type IV pilus minor pilin ComGD [Enterococcus thailandicus]GMC01579.1 competence protein ComYD [Enterococcus thailandicus]